MSKYIQYKVKDIQLAEWGRREIKLAEAEMPGLISLRKEYYIDICNLDKLVLKLKHIL